MLHRGRQHLHAAPRPLVVLALSEPEAQKLLEPHRDVVRFTPYKPLKHFKKYAKNPRWYDALRALATELHPLFPHGFPSALLRGLPMHAGSDKLTTERAFAYLKDLSRTQPTSSHLHQAFHQPHTWMYRDVKAGGSGSGNTMEKEAMGFLGFEEFRVSGTGARGPGRLVYAHDQASADRAWSDFYARLPVTPPTKTPS